MRWWDLEQAAALEARLFADAWSPVMFWSELAGVPASRYYVVAARDDMVLGYAGLFVSGVDADVLTVSVDPSLQGRGVGARLLDDLLIEADRRGATRVTLEVRADNERAQTLYARRGFEQIGVRRGYYAPDGVDALVMQLRPARIA